LLQVVASAAKHLGVQFLFRALPGARQSSDPHVVLTYSNSKFEWRIPEVDVVEEKEHRHVKTQFDQLFDRLLPFSNKEVPYARSSSAVV
jgi:hypothetical protein